MAKDGKPGIRLKCAARGLWRCGLRAGDGKSVVGLGRERCFDMGGKGGLEHITVFNGVAS